MNLVWIMLIMEASTRLTWSDCMAQPVTASNKATQSELESKHVNDKLNFTWTSCTTGEVDEWQGFAIFEILGDYLIDSV